MNKNYNDYIKRKSFAVKELFKINAPKGMSDNEFTSLQKCKIVEILNINPNFFIDINIEGKNILDYYSSINNMKERESFFKVMSNSEIINKVNLSSNLIYSLAKNLSFEIKNNKFEETKKEFKFLSKIIFKYWKKDLSLLENKNFKGGNICSHFISEGISNYHMFKNEINNVDIKKSGLKKEVVADLINQKLKNKNTFSLLYFSLLSKEFSNNINNCNDLVEENIKIANTSGLDSELTTLIEQTFNIIEKKFISNEILDLIDIKDVQKTAKKKRI